VKKLVEMPFQLGMCQSLGSMRLINNKCFAVQVASFREAACGDVGGHLENCLILNIVHSSKPLRRNGIGRVTVFRLKNERFRWFINGYSQTQGKNWYQDVWRADISGYPSLCNDYFGRGPQFVDLFDVFMVQLFFETNGSVLLLWTEEERFLTAVDSSRWQLILGCSSRRDGNTQVATASQKIWRYAERLKYMSREMICWPYSSFLNGGRLKGLTDCAGIRASDCGTLQSWWTKR
jgi:hypothetical protein